MNVMSRPPLAGNPNWHDGPHVAAVEVQDLHKNFASVKAVRGLNFEAQAGRVTGFLGPNGAGKSTTLRALLGLVRPSAGDATFDGRRYKDLPHPTAAVGAVLEDTAFHPGRTARNHLRVLAVAGEHPPARVEAGGGAGGVEHTAPPRRQGDPMGGAQRPADARAPA